MLDRDVALVAQANARMKASGGITYPLLRVVEVRLPRERAAELGPAGRLRIFLERYRAWLERQNGLLGSNLYRSLEDDGPVEVRAQSLWRTPEDLANYLAAPQALERALDGQYEISARIFEVLI